MHTNPISDREFELGAKLGAIIQNPKSRSDLTKAPEETLSTLGVTSDVTLLADTADTVHLIIPAQVDAKRVSEDDQSYFEELGRLALGNCMYEDMPD